MKFVFLRSELPEDAEVHCVDVGITAAHVEDLRRLDTRVALPLEPQAQVGRDVELPADPISQVRAGLLARKRTAQLGLGAVEAQLSIDGELRIEGPDANAHEIPRIRLELEVSA